MVHLTTRTLRTNKRVAQYRHIHKKSHAASHARIYNDMPYGIIQCSAHFPHAIPRINKKALRLLRLENANRWLGKPIAQCLYPEDNEQGLALCKQVLLSNHNVPFKALWPAPSHEALWVSGVVHKVTTTNKTFIIQAVFFDTTVQKKQQFDLEKHTNATDLLYKQQVMLSLNTILLQIPAIHTKVLPQMIILVTLSNMYSQTLKKKFVRSRLYILKALKVFSL